MHKPMYLYIYIYPNGIVGALRNGRCPSLLVLCWLLFLLFVFVFGCLFVLVLFVFAFVSHQFVFFHGLLSPFMFPKFRWKLSNNPKKQKKEKQQMTNIIRHILEGKRRTQRIPFLFSVKTQWEN